MGIQSVDKANKLDEKSTGAGAAATAHRKHACEIEVTFPTNLQAEQALKILQVDKEPTDRVSKSFQLVREEAAAEATSTGGNDSVVCKLKV